jgi:CheY-like chemotaxis protein
VYRLLFIEDDDQIRLALRLALEDEGYTVDEAADGREGLAAFARSEPDLVLVDLRLPDLPGFDVCRTIRARSIVPIIIVTAQTDTIDLVAGLEAGAHQAGQRQGAGGPHSRPFAQGAAPGDLRSPPARLRRHGASPRPGSRGQAR